MIGRRSHDAAQSFDEAWNGRTPRDEHVAELVRVAESLCEAASAAEPSAEFRRALRSQLMAEAATVLVPIAPAPRRPVTTGTPSRARRRVATVTAALVASAGAVGIVASSASAVPGEMLYPVKRSVESVELQLRRDDASRGALQLAQASERLAEARRLSADGKPVDLIVDTLDDFSSAATTGSSKLFTDFTATGQEESIQQVNDFAAASSVDLSELSAGLPDGVSDSLATATAAVTDLASEASSLCGSCAPADLRAFVGSATTIAEPGTKAAPKASSSPAPVAQPTRPAASTPNAPRSASRSTPAPTTPTSLAPVPSPTPKAPTLTDLTDPLLGGLLGNDEQIGLVPGLLNGLLGTSPKP